MENSAAERSLNHTQARFYLTGEKNWDFMLKEARTHSLEVRNQGSILMTECLNGKSVFC